MLTRGNLSTPKVRPGFLLASFTDNTLTTDGGNSGCSMWYFIPADELNKVYHPKYSFSYGQIYGVAYGNGYWHTAPFSTQHYLVNIPDGIGRRQSFPYYSYIKSSGDYHTTAIYNFNYANNKFIVLDYANPATTWSSSKGNGGFTPYIGNYPAYPGRFNAYNHDDNIYAVPGASSGVLYYTTNSGQTWTAAASTPGATLQGMAYGKVGATKTWVAASDGSSYTTLYYSLNNFSSWTSVTRPGLGSIYDVKYGKGRFVACGGYYNGSNYKTVILTSTDGITWTNLYGTSAIPANADFFGYALQTDNKGNWVCAGLNYTTSQITTNQYLYSSDNGSNWFVGTFPQNLAIYGPIAYGDGS